VTLSYEESVYLEDVQALAAKIKVVLDDWDRISDPERRSQVMAAALLTSAQMADGNRFPEEGKVFKSYGVADFIRYICTIVKK